MNPILNLPPGIFVLPLTPGATLHAQRSTVEIWNDAPAIKALSAQSLEVSTAALIKRDSDDSSSKPRLSTAELWDCAPGRKK